jgi:DNA polymerase-4
MLAHVDMDAFYAAVEVVDHPRLAGLPVIVGGGRRGVVSAASYEARAFGVHSAQPIFEARRLCPQGEFLPVRMSRYRQVSAQVMEVLLSFTPLLEQVSVDEAYLDLAGTEGLWGPPAAAARAIKAAVRQTTGLTCSVGLAPVRFLAKIASDRDKPDGLTLVADMEAFLATVSLKEVPGVGAKTLERLRPLGLTMLTQVRALGQARLESLLGSYGGRLWDLAHGRDHASVYPERQAKSVSHEQTFERDLDRRDPADRQMLDSHLLLMCQRVAARLRRHGLAGRTVTLKLKHADFRQITLRQTLGEPTDSTQEIHQAARGLLDSAPAGRFRLMGVGVSGLAPLGQGQGGLFDGQRRRQSSLSRAEDAVRGRFGEKALVRAGALPALKGEGPPEGGDA